MQFKTPSGSAFEIPAEWWSSADMDRWAKNGMRHFPIGLRSKGVELVRLADVEPPARAEGVPGLVRIRMVPLLMALSGGTASLPPVEVTLLDGTPFRYRVKDGFHRYYLSAAAGFTDLPVAIVASEVAAKPLPGPSAIYCADIGSARSGRFAWFGRNAAGATVSGKSMSALVDVVSHDLAAGLQVALGFECPLFVPLPTDALQLTSARVGERGRPWSAGAGCGSLATGLVQVAWILRELRGALEDPPGVYLDWRVFSNREGGLFLWEAFVSGKAKRADHVDDAAAAVEAFLRLVQAGEPRSAVSCPGECYSLIGAALVRTGWSDDPSLLSRACLVVQAPDL